MMDTKESSQSELIGKVIRPGLCVACGACVGYCPYLEYKDGRIVVLDQCQVQKGTCNLICPQLNLLNLGIEEAEADTNERYLMARSTDQEILACVQYGGVVSSIVSHLLEAGVIDSAILTNRGGEGSSRGTLVRSKKEVLSCAGSRYTASGTLSALNLALKNGEKKIGIVGVPCQMKAVSLMETHGRLEGATVLKIGLFCTWALDYRAFEVLMAEVSFKPHKFDIPPPPANVFVVQGNEERLQIPLERLRPAIQKGCSICPDMTSRYADISVGAAEGIEGYNTVIVWTDKGKEILDECGKKGLLELRPLPQENLSHLMEASHNKKKRAIVRLKERATHEGA